jgi:hypothetical protein
MMQLLLVSASVIAAFCVSSSLGFQFTGFGRSSIRGSSRITRWGDRCTPQLAPNDGEINIPNLGIIKADQMEPTFEDMIKVGDILKDINSMITENPEAAVNVISANLGFLFSRNIPKLTQMLLSDQPSFREDQGLMKAYMFTLDFLEAVSKETQAVLKRNQNLLRILLEATKVSEAKVEEIIAENREQMIGQEFMMYLDSEIESQSNNSPTENLLVTVKLRLMDEMGKNLGIDVMILPKLASETHPGELQRKTIEFLDAYTLPAKELFVQTLQIMRKEMQKRYDGVDPMLVKNLDRIEKIAQSRIQLDLRSENQ